MIENTFVFIPGIGRKTEDRLWQNGIFSWNDLKKADSIRGFGKNRTDAIMDYIRKAEEAVRSHRVALFTEHLPSREYWRVYEEFRKKAIFLDIETTGLSLYYDKITLIGTFDGREVKIFVKDNNLDDLANYLLNYEIIVTFNGKRFDIPFIKKELPNVKIPPMHIDLRYVLRSLGLKGPLKRIEIELGLQRPDTIKDTSSRDAPILWSKFVKGDYKSLEKLTLYNINDVANLLIIMEICYRKKLEEVASRTREATDLQNWISKEVISKSDVLELYQRNSYHGNSRAQMPSHKDFGSRVTIPKAVTILPKGNMVVARLDDQTLFKADPGKIRRVYVDLEGMIRTIEDKHTEPTAVGVDLSGSSKKRSGFCYLKGKAAYLSMLKTDRDITVEVNRAKASIVSIDSPLSLPGGRHLGEDARKFRKYGIMRDCERTLKKRGINVYPCLIKSMRRLTFRGMKLSSLLETQGNKVIESYPGAAQDILQIPRKRVDLAELERDLRNLGIEIASKEDRIIHDELDALTSALVGYFYLAGKFEPLGNDREGYLIVPTFEERRGEEIKR